MIRADERLQRLLLAFPLMADEPALTVEQLAARVGCTPKELTRDFASLERYDVPGGWVDTVQVYIDRGQASMHSSHFRRPQRFNRPEMLALDLGLGMLHVELPVDEREVVARTRRKLQALTVRRAATVAEATRREDGTAVESVQPAEMAVFAVLQRALESRHVVQLTYQRPDETSASVRRVRPYALVRVDAHVYLVGWCERAEALRVFRLDRVVATKAQSESYTVPEDFSLAHVVQQGGVFSRDSRVDDVLVVRYSARVARWVAERTGRTVASDGTLELSYPLADEAWAVRHVLQYGGEAVVLSPGSVRERVIGVIDGLLAC